MAMMHAEADSGRYVRLFLSVCLLLVVLSGLVSFLGYRYNITDFHFLKLFHYQMDKLARGTAPEVVFVGDSSLGNAIDVGMVREKRGVEAYNLALTGAFGYVGSHNMIQQVLAVGRPKLVVIMHTVDMMSREETLLADLLTTPDPDARVLELPLKEVARAYLTFDSLGRVMSGVKIRLSGRQDDTVIANDYVKQGERGARRIATGVGQAIRKLPATAIRDPMLESLRRVALLCGREGLHCVYAHGPLVAPLCEEFAPFIRAANARIRAIGLPLLSDTPYCVPVSQIGDADDHVAPAFKQTATRYYLDRLPTGLRETGGADPAGPAR